jgi:hypothetical protein
MLVRKLTRFLKLERSSENPKMDTTKGDSQQNTHGKRERPKREISTHNVQCYECSGFGHNRTECPNFLIAKSKTLNACMSKKSESDDFKNSKVEKKLSFMAFPISMRSVGHCEVEPLVLVETCDEE